MNTKKLKQFLEEKKVPQYRFKQILKAIYQEGKSSFLEISTIPLELRKELDREIKILPFIVEKLSESERKDSFKALLKLDDGNFIETVIMKQHNNWSVCISSQVGCAVGCKFCATGQGGFKRNLTWIEIISQVLFWKQYIYKIKLEGEINNIVFMGMGEPFLNYKEVKESILKLTDENLFALSMRHISISSSGIIPKMKKFTKDFPQVNLAISIISANNETREKLMPVNKKYDLLDIKKFLDFYFQHNNRKVFLEYVLFAGVNDSRKDMKELIEFINLCSRPDLLHVNLISYNETIDNFKPVNGKVLRSFEKYLRHGGVHVTVRRSLGDDIEAACGQLAGK